MTHALGNVGKNDKVMYGYNFKKFSFLSTSSFTFRKCNHDVFNFVYQTQDSGMTTANENRTCVPLYYKS
jgi:hypothetical protein